MKNLPNRIKKILIVLFWLCLWQAVSVLVRNRILLVGPAETVRALILQAGQASFWRAVAFSTGRICLGFLLAFAAGIATGALSYRSPAAGAFLSPPIQFMKSVPVASFVILALVWTGSRNLSVLISFLVAFPMIHMATETGLMHTDAKLLEMARVFRVPAWKTAFYIHRPSLYPYLLGVCRSALGMAFKSGVAAEVIGVPDGSIGEKLYMAKIYLSTAELFAWTFTVIAVSALFEKGFLALLRAASGPAAEKAEK